MRIAPCARRGAGSGLLAVCLLVGSACVRPSVATTPPSTAAARSGPAAGPTVKPASLEERAGAYWARRQAEDLTGAYPFYCSSYRSRVSLAQFLQMTRLVRFDLLDIRIANVEAAGDRAEVTIAYRFPLPKLGQLADGRSTTTWMRDTGGEWCKEDEPLLLPSSTTPVAAPG